MHLVDRTYGREQEHLIHSRADEPSTMAVVYKDTSSARSEGDTVAVCIQLRTLRGFDYNVCLLPAHTVRERTETHQ